MQLNEFIKLSEYQGSKSFFDLGKGHSDLYQAFKAKTFFSQKHFGDLEPELI